MTNIYLLKIFGKGHDAVFKIAYKNGKFQRLERKRGKLNSATNWRNLMNLVPEQENEFKNIPNIHRTATISLEVKGKAQSLHAKAMAEYFAFYQKQTGIKPRINATEGKALKSILAHLKTIAVHDDDIFDTWVVILTNWHKLEPFYQAKMELKNINSNINLILRQIKNGQPNNATKRNATTYADDIRKSI